MPETGRQKFKMSNQIVGLDDKGVKNSGPQDKELDFESKHYSIPGEEKKDGGAFGETRVLVNDDKSIVVKKSGQIQDPRTGALIGNTAQREAAFTRLAHEAAKKGEKSRVVPILGLGKSKPDGENDLLVMDFVAGGNVKKMVETFVKKMSQFKFPEIANALTYICRETALGVAQISAAGIVHLDLKPDNILLDANMDVKIADFGCAAFEGDKTVFGHQSVRAPEVSERMGATRKSDVYSLGKMFEMVGGVSFMISGITGPAKAALEKDPEKRPTAEKLAGMLQCDETAARETLLQAAGLKKPVEQKDSKQKDSKQEESEHEEPDLQLDDYFANKTEATNTKKEATNTKESVEIEQETKPVKDNYFDFDKHADSKNEMPVDLARSVDESKNEDSDIEDDYFETQKKGLVFNDSKIETTANLSKSVDESRTEDVGVKDDYFETQKNGRLFNESRTERPNLSKSVDESKTEDFGIEDDYFETQKNGRLFNESRTERPNLSKSVDESKTEDFGIKDDYFETQKNGRLFDESRTERPNLSKSVDESKTEDFGIKDDYFETQKNGRLFDESRTERPNPSKSVDESKTEDFGIKDDYFETQKNGRLFDESRTETPNLSKSVDESKTEDFGIKDDYFETQKKGLVSGARRETENLKEETEEKEEEKEEIKEVRKELKEEVKELPASEPEVELTREQIRKNLEAVQLDKLEYAQQGGPQRHADVAPPPSKRPTTVDNTDTANDTMSPALLGYSAPKDSGYGTPIKVTPEQLGYVPLPSTDAKDSGYGTPIKVAPEHIGYSTPPSIEAKDSGYGTPTKLTPEQLGYVPLPSTESKDSGYGTPTKLTPAQLGYVPLPSTESKDSGYGTPTKLTPEQLGYVPLPSKESKDGSQDEEKRATLWNLLDKKAS